MWKEKPERGSLHNNTEIEIGSDISNGGSSMILFTCPFGLKQGESGRGVFWGCRRGHEMVGTARWWVVIRHCMRCGENFIGGQVGENLPSEKYLLRLGRTRNTLPHGVPVTARFRTSLYCVPGGHAKWVSYGSAGHGPLQHNLVCPVVSRRPHFKTLRSDKYKQPPFLCPFHIALSLSSAPLHSPPLHPTRPHQPK